MSVENLCDTNRLSIFIRISGISGSLKQRSLAAMEALRAAKEALKAKNRNSAKVHSRGCPKPMDGNNGTQLH